MDDTGAADGVQGAEVSRTAPDGGACGSGEPDVRAVGAAADALAAAAVVGPGAGDGVQGAEAPRTAPDGGTRGVGEPGEGCAAGEPVVAQAPGGHWAASGVEGRGDVLVLASGEDAGGWGAVGAVFGRAPLVGVVGLVTVFVVMVRPPSAPEPPGAPGGAHAMRPSGGWGPRRTGCHSNGETGRRVVVRGCRTRRRRGPGRDRGVAGRAGLR
jgi:hypothetical protein